MIEHEYSLRADLDPAWAARPLAVTERDGRTVLVLEDPGGEPLERLLGAPLEMGRFLRLAIGIVAALGKAHRHRLVHKDLKPANVLVNRAGAEVRLTGFGIASRLLRERQAPEPPEFIAGTLAYMAPEQTGRMNRSIDSRTDLYALGVTLYQMVTGTLPFSASDPMDWVHCHIARKAVPPRERLENVPTPVSAIIMKLLAKTAEERYQTAGGVERDLRRCVAEWEVRGCMGDFPLGQQDTPDRLVIPETLYGRARDVETLLASFDRIVQSGAPELVLVSGYSGIGKSSVVHELHKVLVPVRGLFAAGKIDPYKRDTPYSALAQALHGLVQHLLGRSDAELRLWRDALLEALRRNGRLIVDLVPGLKLIIGEQPPVPELPPQEAQQRFQLALRRFIGVFARPDHPLVLFLDDLQWVDAATLDLLEDLLAQPDVQHLMLIGAYRDNEVGAAHPLTRKLHAIETAGGRVGKITLPPLAQEHLAHLIADALRCGPDRAAPLAQLVHAKTGGNPFFAIQFISSLADEGLLAFHHDAARWSWDLGRIYAKGYSDNVIDLVTGKLNRLPAETQEALQQLACLGGTAAITTLSIVLDCSGELVHATLWPALRQELVARTRDAYRFVHDRVREAAYSLIADERRGETHLRIGRRLAARIPPGERDAAIFDIVNQLNRGAALITSREEREHLAELNLLAGKRAQASAAYASALDHLVAGAALLRDDPWVRRHELTFELELHRAECELVTGALAEAEEHLAVLSTHAGTTAERASVTCLRVDMYTTLGQSSRAVAVGLDYLQAAGVAWTPHPTDEDVRREYERMRSRLGNRAIEDLIDLPVMTDPASLATMDVLTHLRAPASLTDANVYALAVCHAVCLSIDQGNSDASCAAYAAYGTVAANRFDDCEGGFRVGQVACELVERRGSKRFQVRTHVIFASQLMAYGRHLRAGCDLLRGAFVAADRSGDPTYAAYARNDLIAHLLALGEPLADVHREAEDGLASSEKTRVRFVTDSIRVQLGLIRTLRGRTPTFGSFDDATFDERRIERRFFDDPELAPVEAFYWIHQLQARFLAGDHAAAIDASSRTERLYAAVAFPLPPVAAATYRFFSALARAAACDSATPDERREHLEAMAQHHRRLVRWEQACPENFGDRAALVGAEIARVEGRALEAMDLYERATRSARASGFIHHEAIANELAARFHAARGFEKIANAYLRDARHGYLRWGAEGKVRQLDASYPHLRETEPAPAPTDTVGTPFEHIDLATVIRVSQAVSGEIVLERLVETLLRTAIEHAGAERGLLLLARGSELRIQAEAKTGSSAVTIRLCDASISAAEVPESLVHYAARTQESVILDDACARGPFSGDEYLRRQRARSILCLPLIKQGRLVALLYLENTLASGAFTPARIAVLNVLASQAAMSLENSRLYRELEEREAKIRRLVDANIVGVLIADADGRIVEANDAFLAMVGYSRRDLASGRLQARELTPPEWQGATERAVAQVRTTGTCEVFEKEYFRRDGSRVPVLVAAATIEGSSPQALAFVLDLTERKRAEEERESLRRAHAELARVSRITTLGELTAALAHEIRQPIAAAATNAQACVRWLARGHPDLLEARAAATRMVKETNRAAEIISRVQSLYKKGATQGERVDVNDVARETLALLRTDADRYRVSMRADLADLPSVVADRVQLQQVLMNLMLNGIEAMQGTGGELTVTSERSERGELLLSVNDTGAGVPADELDVIFNAFFTTKPQGTGMGLTISRSIVESHGGRLWASVGRERGTTFQFTLPIERVALDRHTLPPPGPSDGAAPPGEAHEADAPR